MKSRIFYGLYKGVSLFTIFLDVFSKNMKKETCFFSSGKYLLIGVVFKMRPNYLSLCFVIKRKDGRKNLLKHNNFLNVYGILVSIYFQNRKHIILDIFIQSDLVKILIDLWRVEVIAEAINIFLSRPLSSCNHE